jgi:hypothetical protein
MSSRNGSSDLDELEIHGPNQDGVFLHDPAETYFRKSWKKHSVDKGNFPFLQDVFSDADEARLASHHHQANPRRFLGRD